MNKKDRLLDFVLFVLSDFEELLNEVSWFFKQPFKIQQKLKEELDNGTFIYESIIKQDDSFIKSEIRTAVKFPEKEYTFPVFNVYRDYIEEHLKPFPKKLLASENYKDDFKSIREFLSEKEEFILLKYLNDNFCYKFDKENYKLAEDFSNEELSGYFKRYIKFKNANDK